MMRMLFSQRPLSNTPRHRARKGSTAVEFALIAPVFFLMMIGLTELSLMLLSQHLLENATFNASRLAKTGYVTTGSTQLLTVTTALNNELASLAPLVNASKVTFTTQAYANLSSIASGNPVNGLGTPQQIVVYTVTYPWTFFTPMIGQIMGGTTNTLNLTARIVARNEP